MILVVLKASFRLPLEKIPESTAMYLRAKRPHTTPANSASAVHQRTLVETHRRCQHGDENPQNHMQGLNHIAPSSHSQERKYRRFSIRYPVSVRFDLGDSVSELRAISNNVSMGGVLLEADSSIPQHCGVQFIIQIRGHHIVGPTQIVGEGEVVRVEPHHSGVGYAIAVKCKHPIAELRTYLPASAT